MSRPPATASVFPAANSPLLAAALAAITLYLDEQSQPQPGSSRWARAARRQAVTPFDRSVYQERRG